MQLSRVVVRQRLSALACAALLLATTAARAQQANEQQANEMTGVPVSLTTVVHLALSNSTEVRLAQTDFDKASAQLSESRRVYIPNLILGSSVGPPAYGFPVGQPSVFSVSSSSLVLSFSQPDYIRAARFGMKAAESSLKDAREQVILEAATEYMQLDTVIRELSAAGDQAKAAARMVVVEQQRVDAGVDARSELLQARLTQAELKLKRMHLETQFGTLRQELASLTGLPAMNLLTDEGSVPLVPAIRPLEHTGAAPGVEAASLQAQSHLFQAKGDTIAGIRPQVAFGVQYNRDAAFSGYENYYKSFQSNNISAGIQMTLPLFDPIHQAKRRESAAQALRAKIEAEQARHQNEEQIATLDGNIAELDAMAEVAELRQQIAADQIVSVNAQLATGNGAPGTPQLTPRAREQSLIQERQRYMEALEAGFDLTHARLALMRALGAMGEWMTTLPGAAPTAAPGAKK